MSTTNNDSEIRFIKMSKENETSNTAINAGSKRFAAKRKSDYDHYLDESSSSKEKTKRHITNSGKIYFKVPFFLIVYYIQ